MKTNFIRFVDLVNKFELNQINYTYLNRNATNLLGRKIPNTKLRIGERYVLKIINLFEDQKISGTDNFDFNGYADFFFKICHNKNYKISIYGGSESDVASFVSVVSKVYDLNVVDFYNGFMSPDFYTSRVKHINCDIIILGLGNPKQNIVLFELADLGITGIHTCGAFISQFSIKLNRNSYLPVWLFRSITEKNHFYRTIKSSLSSFFEICLYYLFKKQ